MVTPIKIQVVSHQHIKQEISRKLQGCKSVKAISKEYLVKEHLAKQLKNFIQLLKKGLVMKVKQALLHQKDQ